MEGERLGRVVAVAPLALLTPVACAASECAHLGARPPAVPRQRIPRRAAGMTARRPPPPPTRRSRAATRVLGGTGTPAVQTTRERTAGPRVRSRRPTP